jgi:hypothetical protein
MRKPIVLSDETLTVLTDNVKAVATEYPCNTSFIYQILSGVETDCFAKFLRMWAAAVRADADVSPWLNTLLAVKTRYEKQKPDKPVVECLTDKLTQDAELATKLIEANRDGQIDSREAERILPVIDKMRSTLDLLETHLQFRCDLKVVAK